MPQRHGTAEAGTYLVLLTAAELTAPGYRLGGKLTVNTLAHTYERRRLQGNALVTAAHIIDEARRRIASKPDADWSALAGDARPAFEGAVGRRHLLDRMSDALHEPGPDHLDTKLRAFDLAVRGHTFDEPARGPAGPQGL